MAKPSSSLSTSDKVQYLSSPPHPTASGKALRFPLIKNSEHVQGNRFWHLVSSISYVFSVFLGRWFVNPSWVFPKIPKSWPFLAPDEVVRLSSAPKVGMSGGCSSAGVGTAGGGVCWSPFTPAQWQELEHQALIFKYLKVGLQVPPDLLAPIHRSLESMSSRFLQYPPCKWSFLQPPYIWIYHWFAHLNSFFCLNEELNGWYFLVYGITEFIMLLTNMRSDSLISVPTFGSLCVLHRPESCELYHFEFILIQRQMRDLEIWDKASIVR